MHNTIIEQPQVEPISLDEAKVYLRVDGNHEHALLERLIKTARRMVEDYTSRAMITQVHAVMAPYEQAVTLPVAPFQNIAAIPQVCLGKTSERVRNYRLDQTRPQARVFLRHNFTDEHMVRIEYRCGYGDHPHDVPEPLRQAVLLLVGDLYENRPADGSGKAPKHGMPAMVRSLLEPYRILRLG